MNREEITRMAREAGMNVVDDQYSLLPFLERFAALVVAAERNSWPAEMEAMERQVNILTDALAQAKAEEREACAKMCEDFESVSPEEDNPAPWHIAAAIRARGNT